MRYRVCLLLACSYWPVKALSGPQPTTALFRRDSIAIDNASGQTTIQVLGPGVRRYSQAVRLRHQGTMLVCDEAIHQLTTNRVIAHGHVRLLRGDSLSISSDSVLYDALNQRATLLGRVQLRHRQVELRTPRLHYNLLTGLVYYAGDSQLADGPNRLTSRKGRYNARTRQLMAYQQVALKTPYTTLHADSLWYTLTDTPTPTVDFAQTIYIAETDLTRRLPGAKPAARTAARPPRKTPPSADEAPPVAPALVQSVPRPATRAVRRAAGPGRVPVGAAVRDEESELERLLNRPK